MTAQFADAQPSLLVGDIAVLANWRGTIAARSVESASASNVTAHAVNQHPAVQYLHVHEATAGTQFLDLGPKGPSFGDELVGANTLSAYGKKVGTDSFICTSVSKHGGSLQCAVVYRLKDGRVTAQGLARLVGKHPLFDEEFAVTGGTKGYEMARGEVRVVQNSETNAELYLKLLP